MKFTPFRACLMLFALFSVGFQLGGLFAPAWHRISVTLDTITVRCDIGFWMVISCTDGISMAGEVCTTGDTLEDMRHYIEYPNDDDQLNIDEEMMIMKILTMVGGILSVCATIMMFLHFRKTDIHSSHHTNGIISSICWGIGAILVVACVAIHGYDYMTEKAHQPALAKQGIFRDVHLPWAMILSASGGFLAIVTGLALAIRMCQNARRTPDYTHASLYKP